MYVACNTVVPTPQRTQNIQTTEQIRLMYVQKNYRILAYIRLQLFTSGYNCFHDITIHDEISNIPRYVVSATASVVKVTE